MFKNYKQFITEGQTDKPLVKKIEQSIKDNSETCPRCGESFHGCICPEKDYFSTMNAYRTPAGKKHRK
jgi:hypothetical protein